MNNVEQDIVQILGFLAEIDPYKQTERQIRMPIVRRRKPVIPGEIWEDDAQHSWHMAIWAWLLMPYYEKPLDAKKVFKMCLCHDLGELDHGDVSAFDEAGRIGKLERELATMNRILALLPPTLAQEMRETWMEYEEGQTDEAKFAQALDKVGPMFQNLISRGRDWKEDKITEVMVRKNKDHRFQHSKLLKTIYETIIAQGRRRKILNPS